MRIEQFESFTDYLQEIKELICELVTDAYAAGFEDGCRVEEAAR